MRPLIRWALGPVHLLGLETLRISIVMARRLFPECDFIVCHNQAEARHLKFLRTLDVDLLDNTDAVSILPPKPGYNVHWKLSPPRLRPEAHEIFIDNDILLRKIPREMTKFLAGDSHALVYEGLYHQFGCFDGILPEHVKINSGVFGLPPGFDFEAKCRVAVQAVGMQEWSGYYDEQGMVATVLHAVPHFTIPLISIPILERNWTMNRVGECDGYHFVGVNSGDHPTWNTFKGAFLI
jgi:hypothetical protein